MTDLKRLEELVSYGGKDRLVTWQDYMSDRKSNATKMIQFETGFPELDSVLDCVTTGEVLVLSGLTGNGKTLFAKSMIRNFAANKVPATVLSYEVITEEFLRPFLEDGLSDATFYVPMELKTGFIPWVEERVLEGKVKFDNKIVLIDHLHYVVDMKTDKMTQNIGAAMRCLKEIAVKHNQTIIVIAHQEKLKDDKEPGIETLRDSSFVGQEADVVIIVHRLPDRKPERGEDPTYDLGYALVKVDKARRSGAFRKRLTFQKKGNWLEPI